MKGKANIGKVLLSVVIAMAMVVTAIPAMAILDNNTNNNNNTNNDDTITDFKAVFDEVSEPSVETIPPGGDVWFYEPFDTGLGEFTADDSAGDGEFSWNSSGWVHYDSGLDGAYAYGVEDDYLNATFLIDAACIDTVTLQFDHWGDGRIDVEVYINNNLVNVTTPDTTKITEEVDITGDIFLGVNNTISFHVYGVTDEHAWFNIDNVTIAANYTIDIAINGIEGMENNSRLNTFPKKINVSVSNRGSQPIDDVDFHLQIYKEEPYSPENYRCWDMETCFLITWDVRSADGDQATWYWSEKRSHSPTHSYHSQPDYLDTYDANSEDYLVLRDWFTIPETTPDGKTVTAAFLNFSQWCEGEFDGTNAVDYGIVYVINATGAHKVGGPYYNTNGEWVYEEIDISDYIGQDIKIQFGWFSDDYMNYEGWYIDDVCIKLAYTSAQPLVFQGYKYANFTANETKIIRFPIEFDPEEGTYFIQVYTDCDDCLLTNNEINWTIWFGDVCDAAVTEISAPAEVEMPDAGYALVPINVTVYNNGTLTEDVPVEITVKHKLVDKFFFDDVESGDLGYAHGAFGQDDVWTITDADFFSPYHSWGFNNNYPGGGHVYWFLPEGIADWDSLLDKTMDITFKAKWGFANNDAAVPLMQVGNTVWYFISRSNKLTNASGGWTDVSLTWMFQGYLDAYGLDNIVQLAKYYVERDGYTWPDDFHGFGVGLCQVDYSPLTGGGAGINIDDITGLSIGEGAVVWTETYIVENLAPGEYASFQVIWNTTEYCDYVISAEIKLDCDQDPSNNKKTTETRIYEQIYSDYEEWSQEDNTYGLPDDWHIVEECSLCPTNHFWWNGKEDLATYDSDRNDVLVINETFNFTGVTEAYLNFTTKYWIEEDWDYGYVEVSNDSGMTWFVLDEYTGNTSGNWTNISLHLLPGTTKLYSPYTDFEFDMPTTFFTENMHFRFRFYSDTYTEEKGWYIDNVNLTVYNGTDWNTLFFDDMESGDANWYHMMNWYGCHWHEEDTFGDGQTAMWFWNGEPKVWEAIGSTLVYEKPPWTSLPDLPENWTFEDNAGDGTLDDWLVGAFGTMDWWEGSVADAEDDYLNLTNVSLPVSPIIQIQYVASCVNLGVILSGYWIEITNGTYSELHYINISDIFATLPVGYIGWDTVIIDISNFSGQSNITISYHFNSTGADGETGIIDFEIWAYLPGNTIPNGTYYNNVDEKLIFEFDLTHAYEAILTWDQNYSFADGDYGYVEIWTGSEWKTLFIVQGNSSGTWGHMELDISSYVGGDEPTKIRYRFVSDGSGVDYGWLIDNVSIEGKVDYVNPTITATLDPATPDGNFDWYKSPVTITLTATDNVEVAAIYYRIDGGPWKTYTVPITIDVDGEHTVDFYAVDEVGNPSDTGTVSFKIDKTAPTVSITFPTAGYIYLFGKELFKNPFGGTIIIGGITFQASASDATSGLDYVTFEVDGMTYEKATSPYEIWWHKFDLLPHKYTLTVSAYDVAGNKATDATLDFTHWL